MALQLVVISILLSITLVSQPQMIDATTAFGPHPELLQHGECTWCNVQI